MSKLAFIVSLLALSSTPSWGQEYAISLNGIDAYGSAGGVGGLVANSTWEAWVRIPQYDSTFPAGARPILCRWGMWTHSSPNIDARDGSALGAGGYSCGAPIAPPGSVSEGQWHHVATVFGPESSPSWSFYLDGQLVNSEPTGCQVPYAGWETVLGASGYIGYSAFLKAELDEVRISNVPRYAGTFTPDREFAPDARTVGLWNFDEGGGNVAYDSSGNGRHFTLHGGYAWVAGLPLCTDPATCCASGPVTYCTAKVNSLGCTPAIGHSGSPSFTGPDDFHITAANILNNKYGLLMWSTLPHSVPFVGGTLCVKQPIRRTYVQDSVGSTAGDDCTGTFDFHFSQSYMAQQQLTSGQLVHAQYWYRDPGFPIGLHYGFTNGLMFSICP